MKATSICGVSSGLGETDSGRLFTETLTTEVKAVFADDTSLVSAQTTLTRALSVFPGAREPNSVVCHGEMISGEVEGPCPGVSSV